MKSISSPISIDHSHEAHPAMRKPTIQDVAREAGTSVSTVSRVLTGNSPVSPDKRAAIEAAVARLGFSPSHIARSLRTRATHTISLLINDIANPFYSALARGVESEANQHGYSLILCNTDDDPDHERQYLKVLRDKQVDGIIFGPTGHNLDVIESLARRIPLVLVDRPLRDIPAISVLADNMGGAFAGAQHILAQGHTRIGVVMWDTSIITMIERLSGVQRALHDAGFPLPDDLILRVPRAHPDEISIKVIEWLAAVRPSAVFALNNQLGVGTLRAIRHSNLTIPDQIALLVFDDLDFFELTRPRITAVAQPAFAMGQRAMQYLAARIQDRDADLPEKTILPTRLIIRESV
jgi:LacI family transcriptional regulator